MAGKRIQPKNLTGKEKLTYIIDEVFLAYNSARLKEACQLFAERMLDPDVTIGMSISGALTPAGLGCSSIIPLIKAGFVDWIVSTGANLYHDMHFALNYPVHAGSFKFDDTDLRDNDLVRIYDVVIPYSDGLMATDELLRHILCGPEFQKEMGTAELHYLLGQLLRRMGTQDTGSRTYPCSPRPIAPGCPATPSSPGDSTIGMNVAGVELRGNKLRVNPSHRRERNHGVRSRRQTRRRTQRRRALGRRQPEKFHAPDRAADPGSAPHQGIRPGLFHPGDRRASRYRRSLRRHARARP